MRTASWIVTMAVFAAWLGVKPAAATVQFDYSFERVEVDGNVHGPYDGTPDLVDEFDDDVLAPNFQRFFGTVEETNGGLRLHDPGNPIPFQLLPFDAEMSEAISSVLMLRDGAGDMRVRAYLRPASPLLGVNHYVHASFWAGSEFVGLAFTNFDDTVSTLYSPPWNVGYLMTAHWEHLTSGLSLQDIALTHVPVDPAAVTDLIVFQLDYDDTAKTVTTAFSLDGGATYQPIATRLGTGFDGSGTGTASLILGADPRSPRTAPPPGACTEGTLDTNKLVLKKLGAPLGDEKVTFKMSFAPNGQIDPSVEGMMVILAEPGASSPFFMVSAPPASADDCWRIRRKGAFSYFDYRKCARGSSGGLTSFRVRQLGPDNVWIKGMVKGVTIQAPTGTVISAAVVRENNVPAVQCTSSDGTFICTSAGTGRRCQ